MAEKDENENVTESDQTQGETEVVEAAVDETGETSEEASQEQVAEAAASAQTEVDETGGETSEEASQEQAAEAAAPTEVDETGGGTSEEASQQQAAEAAVVVPKTKKKRLPRSERPKRAPKKREKAAERKPVTRLPKPEHVRGRRQERQGTVVSASADKTIVVRVDVVKAHPTYKKVIKRSTKFHAHDERNEAKPGDVVRIVETRPLSKLKRWRLQEIVEAAK